MAETGLTGFGPVRGVLFDLDGTLVHSPIDFPRMKEAILSLLEEHSVDPEPYRSLDILRILDRVAPGVAEPQAFLERAEEKLVEIELEACGHVVEAPGARETLSWLLDEGVRVGIVTRNSPQAVRRVLEALPLPHEVLLTRADTPRVKPDPLHLTLALERLQVDPASALMVGDHRMDVEAGKAAGMRTVGVRTDERPADYFQPAAPDGVIRFLPELRTWIFR